MLNPFVCGTSFDHEDDPLLSSSSPRKSKRKDNNNPYSTRGLDKFSALLADLDEKRQKIYSQMRPHDISFVRFMYSNSTDDVVPIVVKVKNKDHQKHKSEELNKLVKARNLTPISESTDKSSTESNATSVEERKKQTKLEGHETKVAKKSFFSWNMKKWDMWKPSFYVPVILILILVLLIAFGRTFATLCTCVLWYIIPTLKGTSSNSNPRKSMKKKDYFRGLSEKKVVTTELGTNKKKDNVRGMSEKKMVVSEGMKKKDYVRRWSEKKMDTEGMVSITSDNPEASKNKSTTTAKHGHKKSW